MRMNKNSKTKLVPKLRFPEFKNAGEWESKTLGNLTYKVGEKNKDRIKYPIYSINNKVGFVPQSEQFDGVDSNTRGYDISLYKVVERNTFAYNPARINVGSIGYSGELHNIMISSLYICFKTKEDLSDNFLHLFVETNKFSAAVNNNVEGGIRNYLFYENFARINIFIPNLAEQQKIADCLSSLDELIAANIEKLDALKSHKKGLMQRLFPAEGETIPQLRFPEFQNDGEWEEVILGEVGTFIGGGTPDTSKMDYWNGNIQWFTPSEIKGKYNKKSIRTISENGLQNSSAKLLPKGALLITTRATIGEIAIAIEQCTTNQGFQSLVVNDSEINMFWYYWIIQNKNILMRKSSGSTFPEIGKNEISKIKAFKPKKFEQQKIADCLSSLDELIAAISNKIEALKQHKKGLMQGLFPKNIEGING